MTQLPQVEIKSLQAEVNKLVRKIFSETRKLNKTEDFKVNFELHGMIQETLNLHFYSGTKCPVFILSVFPIEPYDWQFETGDGAAAYQKIITNLKEASKKLKEAHRDFLNSAKAGVE